jgi:hypothetical protein
MFKKLENLVEEREKVRESKTEKDRRTDRMAVHKTRETIKETEKVIESKTEKEKVKQIR